MTRQFDDGSYLSEIVASRDYYRRADPITVRVVEATLGADETVYRLVTTILDPDAAPAGELATLYAQRWEIETALDEVKTHQGGSNFVLRSQRPLGVEQEIYGFLLTHHGLRELMNDAAGHAEIEPARISFIRTLRVVRRQVTGQAAFSPARLKQSLTRTRDEILRHLLPARRDRSNPRVIKRKMSNWRLKRTHHQNPAPPGHQTVTIVPAT